MDPLIKEARKERLNGPAFGNEMVEVGVCRRHGQVVVEEAPYEVLGPV